MQSSTKIFIIAGEISGDQIGGAILNNLNNKNNRTYKFFGVGGDNLKKNGLKTIFNIEKISLMGLFEIIPKIPMLIKLLNLTTEKIHAFKPDLIITIDSPGFNFRILKKIKAYGINTPVIHIVAPSVWAWKPKRAKTISAFIDYLFVLYPFEKKYFIPFDLKTFFIGHPLIELYNNKHPKLPKNIKKKYLSIFPGSRKKEINYHLDIILTSINEVDTELKFIIVAVESQFDLITKIVDKYKNNISIEIVSNSKKEEVFKFSYAAIAVSGTITLELAINNVPFFTVYKLNALSYYFLKRLVYSKYITLINIILNKRIVIELIQKDFNVPNIKKNIQLLLNNKDKYKSQLKNFRKLKSILTNGDHMPSSLAADYIENIISKNKN